ncbi:hypothetical protein fHeYen902_049c [Yersinia phage fHe-Yen9-02]|nr:hypothetical protein fHeYen902_049c [Yersinia phage fHe-Yen9-02]
MKIKLSMSKALTQSDIAKYWKKDIAHKYKKYGHVLARQSSGGETVVTEIGGKVETQNVTKSTDMIVTNPGGEKYVIDIDKFKKRYSGPSPDAHDQKYSATGTCYAFGYKGPSLQFIASWGEPMILNSGDYLCSITFEPNGDIYRIEKQAFLDTYRRV